MKSLEEMVANKQKSLTKNGVDFAEAVQGCSSLEQRLSKLDQLMLKHNIAESFDETRTRKIFRHNGSGGNGIPDKNNKLTRIDESALRHIKRGMSIREAYMLASDCATDLKNNQLPEHVVAELTKAWREYNGRLSEADAKSLAVRGLRP